MAKHGEVVSGATLHDCFRSDYTIYDFINRASRRSIISQICIAFSGTGEHSTAAAGGGPGAGACPPQPAVEGCRGRSPGAHPPLPCL